MIAKLIAGRSALGNSRQIFFCQIGGHDTHASMLPSHANLMAELSGALLAFRNTLADPGLDAFDDVTTFTMSDFNRTLQANGNDAGGGSDHAWGGHHIIDRWGTPYFSTRSRVKKWKSSQLAPTSECRPQMTSALSEGTA